MRRIRFAVGITLACVSGLSLAQSTTSTESYTYDALGRLTKVEVASGEQDGASRDYNYDKADNRSQVVSTAGANSGGGGPEALPPECALSPGAIQTKFDTVALWPRVSISSQCTEELVLTASSSRISGVGSWTLEGFYQDDNTLSIGPPENGTKMAHIQPLAASVPTGTQLVLNVNWQVQNFVGTGTSANTEVRINGTGAAPEPPCVLGPYDFTVSDGAYSWPRVYAPTSAGCGFPIELSYTITASGFGSGPIDPTQPITNYLSHGFFGNDPILGSDDHTKMVWINPNPGLATPNNPVVLYVNWQVESGNAVIAEPKYSVVTISAD